MDTAIFTVESPPDAVFDFLVSEAVESKSRRALVPIPCIVDATRLDLPAVEDALIQLDTEGLASVWFPPNWTDRAATLTAYAAAMHGLVLRFDDGQNYEWVRAMKTRKGRKFIEPRDRAIGYRRRQDESRVIDERMPSPEDIVEARELAAVEYAGMAPGRKRSDSAAEKDGPEPSVIEVGNRLWVAADLPTDVHEMQFRAWVAEWEDIPPEDRPPEKDRRPSPKAPKLRGCPVCGDEPKGESRYCGRCDSGDRLVEWIAAKARLGLEQAASAGSRKDMIQIKPRRRAKPAPATVPMIASTPAKVVSVPSAEAV